MKYVIAYRISASKTEGRGTRLFSEAEGREEVRRSNATWAGLCHHWLEPVGEKDAPDEGALVPEETPRT